MNPASLQSAANDGGDALSTYLAATLYCDGACSAVRIRNIAATGALVEGGPEPSGGTLVQLVRGELIVHGLVAWSSGRLKPSSGSNSRAASTCKNDWPLRAADISNGSMA